ncbi:PIN domain-containing protein [Ancylobacter terrae]|uniref:PIN domain-containing protein n=1 Tax=Ancylobacter sp. sgz301288 TaxID=3342077 RepID=UPI00385EE354
MFIDASVIVALLAGAPEATALAERIAGATARFTSGPAVLEAAALLSVRLDIDPVKVEAAVQALLDTAGIALVPINAAVTKRAVAAFASYGRSPERPKGLSLAGCLTYACAKAYRVPVLSAGGRFAGTDVEAA